MGTATPQPPDDESSDPVQPQDHEPQDHEPEDRQPEDGQPDALGPDELDVQLRRLFADDRLIVPVSTSASAAVVAGATRRRRNRMTVAATAGVLAVIGVVFAGVAVSGFGRPSAINPAGGGPVLSTTSTNGSSSAQSSQAADSSTPSSPVTITRSPAPPRGATTTSPSRSGPATPSTPSGVLGPVGFEGLKLGMAQASAEATGLLDLSARGRLGQCVVYPWATGSPSSGTTTPVAQSASTTTSTTQQTTPASPNPPTVYLSSGGGVVWIAATPEMHTPAGIAIGASRAGVLAAYPGSKTVSQAPGEQLIVSTGAGNASYLFDLNASGTVTGMALVSVPAGSGTPTGPIAPSC